MKKAMPPYSVKAVLLLFYLGIMACEGVEEGDSAYNLAQTCVGIQPSNSHHFLVKVDDKRYEFLEINPNDNNVEKFFIKPSGLGKFMFYDRQGRYLANTLSGVQAEEEPSANVEWSVRKVYVDDERYDDSHLYSMRSLKYDKRLIFEETKIRLALESEYEPVQAGFRLTPFPPSDCTTYPEASLDAEVINPFQPSENLSVKGFADFHTHIAFTKTLATVAMSGDIFHPYGIEHALNQCNELHGDDGTLDLLESQNSGLEGHDTSGFPDFGYWPNRSTSTHITAYYMWIKRSYLSGLRLLVTNVTGNPSYCQLLSIIHLGKGEGKCNSDDSLKMQTEYIYELQDYIDAQEGGPGMGWFRIAKSSTEAREIINDNKLAVVLGSEYSTLFDCRHGKESCSSDYIERKLDELHALGIRSVFPIHRFDNAFGGTRPQGGSAGAWMHLTSKFSTSKIDNVVDLIRPDKFLFKPIEGDYWDLDHCPEGVQGTKGIKSMKKFVDEDFSFLLETVASVPVVGDLAAKFLEFSVVDKLKPLPEYEEFQDEQPACNRKHLQPSGVSLLEGIMKRGMIIEIDHMSYPTLLDSLSLLEKHGYSGVVSSHDWFENREDVRKRIFSLGGLIAPMNQRPSVIGATLQQYSSEQLASGFYYGVGIGTDIQGIAVQAEADPDFTLNYPFESYDGTVRFLQPKTGNRSFDFTSEGLAHYGLLPEWIENLKWYDAKHGTNNVDVLMSSAEAYLQMWERAEAH